MRGSENRTRPEDTGVILRPSTIATLILDPAAPWEARPDPRYLRIRAESPVIGPPRAPRADAPVAFVRAQGSDVESRPVGLVGPGWVPGEEVSFAQAMCSARPPRLPPCGLNGRIEDQGSRVEDRGISRGR